MKQGGEAGSGGALAVTTGAKKGRFAAARERVVSELPAIAIGLGAVVVGLVWLYDLLGVHWDVPIFYTADANLTMAAARNIELHGWFDQTSQLGAPFGQDLRDFPPVGDGLHLLGFTALARLAGPVGLVLNVFFFASFFTVFVGAYIGARMLDVTRTAAVVVGLLFTFLPFHHQQGPEHLFISSYFAIPLWVAFLVRQLGDRPLVAHLPDSLRPRAWFAWLREPRVMSAVVITVLATTTGAYFAIFFLLIAIFVALVLAAIRGSVRPAAVLVPFVGLGSLVFVLQYLPILRYQSENGGLDITTRGVGSIEFYSLKLSDMLLPVREHRVHELAQLQADGQSVLLTGERTEALGLIAALCVVALFGGAVIRAFRGRPLGRLGPLAVVAGIAFLLGTTGGLAQLFGVLGFTQLRTWSRISIVVAFCGLIVGGMIFDHLRARFALRRIATVAVGAVVVVVGLLDMTPTHVYPSYDDTADQWRNDGEFVHDIEAEFGDDATLFQMPIVRFPEGGTRFEMVDYDQMRGYLHSDTLSWSYGGVKGRSDEWQQRLRELPTAEQVEAVAAVGFDGLWFDRYGYDDDLEAIEAELTEALGPPILTDEHGRVAVFDVRPAREALRTSLGDAALEQRAAEITDPTRVELSGFEEPGENADEADDGDDAGATGRTYAWADGVGGGMRVMSTGADGAMVRVEFTAASAVDGDYDLAIVGPGISRVVDIDADGTNVEFDVAVPAAGVEFQLQTNAPSDPDGMRFGVLEPTARRVDPEPHPLS